MNLILNIFLTFLKIGAFSFGGGYAMIPFIEKEMVQNHGWITTKEFIDIIAIAEMTPGPIAVNSSTFVGYKIAGILGSAAGTIGVILTSFTLMTILANYINKVKDSKTLKSIFMGIRPAVLGLILSAAYSVAIEAIIDFKGIIIAVAVLLSILKFKVHPILTIVLAGLVGYIVY